MVEGHSGFKVAVVEGDSGSSDTWCTLYHQGSAKLDRACVRFHTVEHVVVREGAIVADVQFMGDFGRAVHNETQAVLTPPTCPTQGTDAVADGSTGIRQLPVTGGSIGYEPWRYDSTRIRVGIVGNLTINVRSAIAVCNRIPECDAPVLTNRMGANRFLTANGGLKIDATKSVGTGAFCTDALGRVLATCGSPGATPQYVAPSLIAPYPCLAHHTGRSQGRSLICGFSDGFDINEFVDGVSAIPPNGPN
jgi:hypothetical protein